MALVREFRDDEYTPEFSTLALRDALPEGQRRPPGPAGPPRGYPAGTQPCGTIVRTGDGYLEGAARDGMHLVRLELHDGPPPDDLADWLDVVETPYLCRTGAVGLTDVIIGHAEPDLALDGPGRYAVRASRRAYGPDGSDDEWCLRFWQDAMGSTVDTPRWLARARPATPPGDHGWGRALGVFASNLMDHAREAVQAAAGSEAGAGSGAGTGVTLAQIDAAGRVYNRAGWLDGPLATEPARPLPTGHADLDERAERSYREALARIAAETAELDSIAGQLGAPGPRRVRELLPLLVAAGLLTVEGTGAQARYRVGQPARPALEVLRLPPHRVRVLARQDAHGRYTSFVTDLVSLAVWAPSSPVVSTVDDLAARLLATPFEVRAALWYAADVGQLVLEDGEGGAGPVRFAVGPGPQRQRPPGAAAPQQTPTGITDTLIAQARLAVARANSLHAGTLPQPAMMASAQQSPPPPAALGAPPRAGYLTYDGDLVVWRDGEPVTLLAGQGRARHWSLETAYGVALLSASGCRHVRHDGTVDEFATAPAYGVVSEDGRYLAFSEAGTGRSGRKRMCLVDLADSSRSSMPWDEREDVSVVAMHGGVVYLRARSGPLRWTPGTDPERSPVDLREIDPLSGATLRQENHELVVDGADGTTRRIAMDPSARLAPGGTRLYTLRHAPPAVTLFDVERGVADPVVHWLPQGCRATPRELLWEDEHHLLGLRTVDLRGGPPAIRLDLRTGGYEGVPLTEAAGYHPTLVEPLLRT